MLSAIAQFLAASSLASASGLNAYIPLLFVALAARFTGWVHLGPPFDVLTNGWVIGALVVLLAIEMVVDKVPLVDSANNVLQTVVRPAAGAVVFAANMNVVHLDPVIAAVIGLVLAFGVHAAKSAARPVITAGTFGIGNAFVSLAEDIVAAIVSLIALLVPFAILAFLALTLAIVAWRLFAPRPSAARQP